MSAAPHDPTSGNPTGSGVPKSSWKTLIFGLAVLLIAGGVISSRTLYHEFQDYRARKFADRAKVEMEAENWEAAYLSIQDAMKISPDEPKVLRAAADLISKTRGDAGTMRQLLQKLIDLGEGTDEDQVALGEAMLKTGDAQRARQIYESLPGTMREQRRGLELLGSILESEGETEQALKTKRRALMINPDDPESRLQLAILDLEQPFDEMRASALDRIREISKRNDAAALQAIVFLAGNTGLKPDAAEALRKTVETHPKAEDRHRLVVLSAYMKVFPTRRKDLIEEECAKHKGKGIEDMVPLLRWLGREGELSRIIGLVPKSLAAKSANVFPIYAEALLGTGKWADLVAMIKSNPAPKISAANAHALLAQCASKLEPDLTEAKHQINNAYRASVKFGELQVVARCAELAESLGLWGLASEGYEMLAAKSPQGRVIMLTKVYEMAALSKDADRMLEVAGRISKAKPESWMFRSRVDYLRLILGEQLEEAAISILSVNQVAESKRTEESKSYLAILRALAAFRLGDMAKAKVEMNAATQPSTLPPGIRAVLAGLMVSLEGDANEAFRLAETIPTSLLLEEELRFLKKAL